MVVTERNPLSGGELAAFLANRARAATDTRIAVDVAVGIVAVIVALAIRPDWWGILAGAGATLAAFGLWAATTRAIEEVALESRARFALGIVRKLFAAAGISAALVTGFLVWTVLMGTWIS